MGSILDGKKVLAVDDEPDILDVLEEEVVEGCPRCMFDKALTYEAAAEKLASRQYDVVILDIMGVRGFDLLEQAVRRGMRAVMLTAHALTPEMLDRSYKLGARAFLPKEVLTDIVPLLEDVLRYEFEPAWLRIIETVSDFYTAHFGPDWRMTLSVAGRGMQ
jgi:DNA-binding NtrC family response regulator